MKLLLVVGIIGALAAAGDLDASDAKGQTFEEAYGPVHLPTKVVRWADRMSAKSRRLQQIGQQNQHQNQQLDNHHNQGNQQDNQQQTTDAIATLPTVATLPTQTTVPLTIPTAATLPATIPTLAPLPTLTVPTLAPLPTLTVPTLAPLPTLTIPTLAPLPTLTIPTLAPLPSSAAATVPVIDYEPDYWTSRYTTTCDFNIDIVFVADATVDADVLGLKEDLNVALAPVLAAHAGSRIGLVSFSDKPVAPYGSDNDYCFKVDQGLTADVGAAASAMANLTLSNGGDLWNNQLDAMIQATAAAELGWSATASKALRLMVLLTGTPPHFALDGLNILGLPAYSNALQMLEKCPAVYYPAPNDLLHAVENLQVYNMVLLAPTLLQELAYINYLWLSAYLGLSVDFVARLNDENTVAASVSAAIKVLKSIECVDTAPVVDTSTAPVMTTAVATTVATATLAPTTATTAAATPTITVATSATMSTGVTTTRAPNTEDDEVTVSPVAPTELPPVSSVAPTEDVPVTPVAPTEVPPVTPIAPTQTSNEGCDECDCVDSNDQGGCSCPEVVISLKEKPKHLQLVIDN